MFLINTENLYSFRFSTVMLREVLMGETLTTVEQALNDMGISTYKILPSSIYLEVSLPTSESPYNKARSIKRSLDAALRYSTTIWNRGTLINRIEAN